MAGCHWLTSALLLVLAIPNAHSFSTFFSTWPHTSLPQGCRNAASNRWSMGFAPPQHLTFPPNSETVRDEFHWSHRFLGVTEEWAGPVVKRTHFDTDLFSEKGVVKPKYEGRLRLWSRRSSEEDSEYEVWEVSESSRLASQGPTSMHTRRSSDGHVERRFSRSSDTAKQDLILQPGAAAWSGGFWQQNSAQEPLSLHMQLCQSVADVTPGYIQGVSITYNANGALTELCRSEQRSALAASTDPADPVNFDDVEKTATPKLDEEVAYVSFSCMGNPLVDLVDRARWKGKAKVISFPESVAGQHHTWTAEDIGFTSMCFKEVRSGEYADIRFNDGAYLRLPRSIKGAEEAVLDRGIHRIVALGSKAKRGFHTLSYECFA